MLARTVRLATNGACKHVPYGAEGHFSLLNKNHHFSISIIFQYVRDVHKSVHPPCHPRESGDLSGL